METGIGYMGYSIIIETIPGEKLKQIREDLTVKPLENPNFETYKNTSFPVFRTSKTKIYIPRYYGTSLFGPPTTNIFNWNLPLVQEPVDGINHFQFEGSLRPVQEETVKATLEYYSKHGGGLISLDTGLGKTVVALKLVSLISARTLVLVHADFLLEQWVSRISTFLPNAKIGLIKQERCEYEDCDIIVGMIQSIIRRDYPKECFRSIEHLIIDECHHISSKTFSSIFYKVQTKYMVGLSATPERKDGLSKVIYWFLGPQIVNIKRETNKPSVTFVFTDTDGYVEKLNRNGKINGPSMITDLTTKNERNGVILKVIENLELPVSGRKVLILSERREHCKELLFLLTQLEFNAGLYLGGMKSLDRTETIGKDIIIGTYQASGEGFDVPELDTLILATPKSDIEQAVGRILRQKNKNEPLVIDIVDSFSIFRGQYYKRKKFYQSNSFLIN